MNKEQFLKQFDKIVTGIVDNKQRVRELSELHSQGTQSALNQIHEIVYNMFQSLCYLDRLNNSAPLFPELPAGVARFPTFVAVTCFPANFSFELCSQSEQSYIFVSDWEEESCWETA